MEIKLENESLELTINSFGAELKSITGKETGTQYLWDADEKYWKRSAPVLFPFVGSLKDKKFTVDGTDYPMGDNACCILSDLQRNRSRTSVAFGAGHRSTDCAYG